MYLHLHREQSLSDVKGRLNLNHTAAPENERHFTLGVDCSLFDCPGLHFTT